MGEGEEKRREDEKKKKKARYEIHAYGIYVWNCLEHVWFLLSWSFVWKFVEIFPLVWITSMDTSWNPCLWKGFFLP